MLRPWKLTHSTKLIIFTAFDFTLIVFQGSFRPSLQGSQLSDKPPVKQGALLSATLGISSRTEASLSGQVKLLVWRAKHLASILCHSTIFQQYSEKRLSECTKGSISACKEQTGIQSLTCALCWIILCTVFIALYKCLGLWRRDWQNVDESLRGSASLDYEAELFKSRQEICRLQCELMAEKKARDNDVMNLRRWLDDAQGQLQNTQTALTLKEAEWKDILHGLQATDNLFSQVTSPLVVCENNKELPLGGMQHAMQSLKHVRKCGDNRLACKDNYEKGTQVLRVSCHGQAEGPSQTLGQHNVLATGMLVLDKENMAPAGRLSMH